MGKFYFFSLCKNIDEEEHREDNSQEGFVPIQMNEIVCEEIRLRTLHPVNTPFDSPQHHRNPREE